MTARAAAPDPYASGSEYDATDSSAESTVASDVSADAFVTHHIRRGKAYRVKANVVSNNNRAPESRKALVSYWLATARHHEHLASAVQTARRDGRAPPDWFVSRQWPAAPAKPLPAPRVPVAASPSAPRVAQGGRGATQHAPARGANEKQADTQVMEPPNPLTYAPGLAFLNAKNPAAEPTCLDDLREPSTTEEIRRLMAEAQRDGRALALKFLNLTQRRANSKDPGLAEEVREEIRRTRWTRPKWATKRITRHTLEKTAAAPAPPTVADQDVDMTGQEADSARPSAAPTRDDQANAGPVAEKDVNMEPTPEPSAVENDDEQVEPTAPTATEESSGAGPANSPVTTDGNPADEAPPFTRENVEEVAEYLARQGLILEGCCIRDLEANRDITDKAALRGLLSLIELAGLQHRPLDASTFATMLSRTSEGEFYARLAAYPSQLRPLASLTPSAIRDWNEALWRTAAPAVEGDEDSVDRDRCEEIETWFENLVYTSVDENFAKADEASRRKATRPPRDPSPPRSVSPAFSA